MKKKAQTFNDGILSIYKVDNIAEKGLKPKNGLTIKVGPLRYDEKIVGLSRFWTASQNKTKIERLLRIPRIESVSSQDIVVLNKQEVMQYEIIQIQYPDDTEIPCMDLSLERIEAVYDIG